MSLIVWASCITYSKQLYVLIVYICVNLTFNKKTLTETRISFESVDMRNLYKLPCNLQADYAHKV